MRKISIWVSGLLASAIPFFFVGAVIVFGAYIFEAVGRYAPPTHSSAPFQAEAAPPQEVLTVASANAPNDVAQRQPIKHAHGNARHQHAQSHSHSRVRHSSLAYQWGPALYWSY